MRPRRWLAAAAVALAATGCSDDDGDAPAAAAPTTTAAPLASEAFEARLFAYGEHLRIGYLPDGFEFTTATSPSPNSALDRVSRPGGGPDDRELTVSPSGSTFETFGFNRTGPAGADGTVPGIVVSLTGADQAPEDFLARTASSTLTSASGMEWFEVSPDEEWASVARVVDGRVTLFVNGRQVGVDELLAVGDSIEVG